MLTNRTMQAARYRRGLNGGCGCNVNRYDRRDGRNDGMDHRDYRHDHGRHDHTDSYDQHDRYRGNACPLCARPAMNTPTNNTPCNPEGMTNCEKLLDQIRAVDFALAELVLYLDAYPHCREALDTYHKLIARRRGLCHQYETSCGPLTAMGNHSTETWDWIEGPFPWEYKAN